MANVPYPDFDPTVFADLANLIRDRSLLRTNAALYVKDAWVVFGVVAYQVWGEPAPHGVMMSPGSFDTDISLAHVASAPHITADELADHLESIANEPHRAFSAQSGDAHTVGALPPIPWASIWKALLPVLIQILTNAS